MTGESGFQLKQGGPEVYELCWVRAQLGRSAEELVAAAGVAPGDRVLDIGCGTGVVARAAATLSGAAANVTGADALPKTRLEMTMPLICTSTGPGDPARAWVKRNNT